MDATPLPEKHSYGSALASSFAPTNRHIEIQLIQEIPATITESLDARLTADRPLNTPAAAAAHTRPAPGPSIAAWELRG